MKIDVYSKKNELITRSVNKKVTHFFRSVSFLLLLVFLGHTSVAQTITGTVFRDFDSDGLYVAIPASGTYTYGEPGVAGIIVSAYGASGTLVSTATSTTAGTYSLTGLTLGQAYRVEFTNLQSGDYESFRAPTSAGSATSVQFVAAGTTNVNLGINYPNDYCQAVPNVVLSCYENGNGVSNTNPAIVSFPYNYSGTSSTPTKEFNIATVGSVWGAAYQRTKKRSYAGAFLKRHTGLGPRGMDGVYVLDYSTSTPTLLGGFDLQGVTPANGGSAIDLGSVIRTNVSGSITGDYDLPQSNTQASVDLDAFGKVGTVGYGDLDMSEDGNTLWLVNLYQKALIAVDVSTLTPSTANPNVLAGSLVKQYPLASILNVPSCTNGQLRPFGLEFRKGKGYLGLVCDASSGTTVRQPASLVGYVVSFNPSNPTSFTTEVSFPLNYKREPYYQNFNTTNSSAVAGAWQRWSSTWVDSETNTGYTNFISSPQPVLSDIDFADNGSMIVSVMDRFSHQAGWQNYKALSGNRAMIAGGSVGDILYFGRQGNSFVAELGENDPGRPVPNTQVVGFLADDGVNNAGEFFYGDYYIGSDASHHETSLGSGFVLPGKNEVGEIVFDALAFFDLGVRWLSTSTGAYTKNYQVVANTDVKNFGKGGGLGDAETHCDLPPIQIGNRVFRDVNNNGIQDPGEPGLAGVQVALLGPGSTVIASAVTNANGEYYFSTATGTNSTSSVNGLALTAGSSYTLSFPTSVSNVFAITTPNASAGSNSDAVDSDPSAAGFVPFVLGSAGQNNFTYDAGYACIPPTVALTSATVCAGQSATLVATSGYTSYSFTTGLTPVTGQPNAASITTTTASASTTPYSVTVTNTAGCSAVATGSLTVNPLPAVTLSSVTVCAGQTATLTATAGLSSYAFSTGLTRVGQTNTATIATPTTVATITTTSYSVTVTSAAGCSAVATGSVTVTPNPVVTLSSATVCAGQTVTLTATPGFSSYAFSTGLTQATGQTNTATGTTSATAPTNTSTYSVTVTNATGCSAVATGSVTGNALPVVTLSSATICAGQSATLTATNGLSSYAFSAGLTRIGQTNAATLTTLANAPSSTNFYSVIVTNTVGCSAVATGSVTVNANPVPTLSSATVCAGQTATLTATPGFSSYAFSAGLNQVVGQTNTATLTTSTTVATTTTTPYAVTVTSAAGCSAVATGSVTINPNPVVALSSATVCAGQSATLTATAGFSSYAFSTGLTRVGTTNAATITTLATASASTVPYSVTVTNAIGCSAIATGSVTINPIPVVTLNSVTVCAGQTATLRATTGFSTYAFSAGLTQVVGQTNTATITTPTNIASATTTPYAVTVTNATGCSAVATGSVTVNPTPVVTLSSTTVCAGQTATLTATPGFSSYAFSTGLSEVVGQSNAAALTTLATASAGTAPYSVTVTNAAGCSAIATGSVTINANPVVSLNSVTVCAGQTATLTATPGFSSYAFSTGLTQVVGQTNTATLNTSTNASAGSTTYSVTVTNAAGCSTVATGSVTINATPVVTLSSTTICAGQTVTLTATPGFSSYAFSTGPTQVVGQTNTATLNTSANASASTTFYSVTATNATGCSAVATGSVTINARPVVTLSSVTVCAGQTATLTATPGFSSYAFSPGPTQVVGQTNTATLNTSANALASTTPYSVTVTNATGCSAIATGSVTINANPVVALSSATVCAGQTATLTATAGFSSYAFSAGLTQVVGQNNAATLATSTTVTTATTTPFSVTVTNATGCSAIATGSVIINPTPVVTLNSVTVCAGQTVTLRATAGFSSYAFSTGLPSQTNTTTFTAAANAPSSTTPYSVTVTNAAGCSAVVTASITVNATPVVTLNSVTVCAGQTATLAATPGFSSYAFSSGLAQVVGQTNTATITTLATASTTSYSVTVTNTAGCSAVATGSVTVNANPVVTLGSATVCAGQTATLTATPGFSSYAFSAGLTRVGQTNTAKITTLETAAASTTPYSVTVTNTTGCSAVATGSVTTNPLPTATLTSVTLCTGQTAFLTAAPGYATYQFSAGLTQVGNQPNTATTTTAGTYSVSITSAAGCSSTAVGSVSYNNNPVVTLTSTTICTGQTATLTATPGFGSYAFSAGLTPVAGQPNVATATLAGTYSVTATSNASCFGTATATVTISTNPVVTLSSSTICAGQTATLTATGGYSAYQFAAGLTPVTGQANAATLNTLATAAASTTPYSVTVTNISGCSAVATGSITVNPNPVVTLTSTTVCAGQTATLAATPGFSSYAFSSGLAQVVGQTNTAVLVAPTTLAVTTTTPYSVTVTSAAGCSAVTTGTVTVNPNPVVTLSSVTVCAGQTATLRASGGFSSYVFSAGLTQGTGQGTTATITTLATASAATTPYSVTVTNAAGCSAVATGSVTVNPTPTVTLGSVTICAGQTATLTATPGFAAYQFSTDLTLATGQANIATLNTLATAAASTTPYSVTVTNATGCSAIATGSVTVNANPVVTLSSVTVCAGQAATLTATPGFGSYAFSAGLTEVVGQTNAATLMTPATLASATTTPYSVTVTVTDVSGCSAVAAGSITVNPNPVVTLSSATVCAGQSATLTATAGFASYQFSAGLAPVNGQANLATLTTLATAPGSTTPYSVTVTNATGCSAVATGSITVSPTLVVTITSTTVCAGQTATLTASPGFNAYVFSTGLTPVTGQANVVTLATSATASSSNTPYSVTITSSQGCSGIATGSVTVNANPVVTLSSATVCAGQTATLTATPGFSSYAFSSGLAQVVGQTNTATLTTPIILASDATPYSVTVTNAAGCSAVTTGTVTVNPNPVVTLSSVTVCAGQTATLRASGGFSSYVFSAGLTQGTGQGTTATITTLATASAATTPYSVTVTNAAGCSAVATGSVTVNPTPTVTLGSVTVCAGQTATLTATPGFSSYVFSTGLAQVVGQTNAATLTTMATASASTTPYSVTVTNATGCSAVTTGSVTVNPNPVVLLTSTTVCAGQTATLIATAGFASYQFSTDLTPATDQTNVATLTTMATASAATTPYSVTVTNAVGCSAVATGSVTVNPNLIVALNSVTVCAGQTATLTATGGFSTYAFSAGLTSGIGQTNVATIATSATALASTTPYSVTVTNATGCSAIATGSVTVNPTPAVTLGSVTVCAGQTATLTATDGFSAYAFSAGLAQVVGQINAATITTPATLASTITTPYSVTVTSVAGCSAVATGSITVNPNPVVLLTSVTVCAGQTATLTATAGFASYQFSADLTPTNGQTNTATLNTLATATATTTPYSVTVTNATGCSAIATGSVTVNPNPVVTLSSVTVCASQVASLTATGGFTSYQFSTGLAQVVGQTNAATITALTTLTSVTTTPYSVTVTNATGCSATAIGSVTVNPTPVLTLSSVTVCAGQTATLTATAGFNSYTFSTGLTQLGSSNAVFTANGGAYSVTATDVNGCSAVATGSVTVNPNPVVTLSSATICAGQSTTLTATAGFASYSFSAGLTPVTGQPNVAVGAGAAEGTYSVTVTNAAGCSNTATGTVTFSPNPVVTLSSATICAGQTASLTATSGYATYQFSAGLTPVASLSNAATGLTSGTYSVTATSTAGCSSTATGTIFISPTVAVTLSSATICTGQTGVLTATAGYDRYIFSAGLTQVGTSNVASTTVAGTYSVTVISSAGCSGTATATLLVNPTAVVALSSATICAGQSATLTATAGFANYAFSAGLTPVVGSPNVAIGTVAGTYSVTAISNASCSGSATAGITINPVPVASLTISSATLCQGQSATLTASGGNTYLWSTSEQTPSIVVTVGNVYSVTVISAGGCTDVASTTIAVNPQPVLTINSATVCSGQSASLTVGGCDGGTILWANGANTATILVAPTLPTTYSVTCTFATGCSSTTATRVDVFTTPSYSAVPQAFTASCTGAVANNDATILLQGLQGTEQVGIVLGSTYANGPAYGAVTNLTPARGIIGFRNLPNPSTSQPYTIRLFGPGGICYTDVTVILEPAFCNCPPAKCVPFVIRKTQLGRTAIR